MAHTAQEAGKRFAAIRNIRFGLRQRQALLGFVFVLPWLIGFLWFQLWPVAATLVLGFTKYSVLTSPEWIGTRNFADALRADPLFWKSVYNTLYYAVFVVAGQLVLGLAIALLLNTEIRGIVLYRTAFYLPHIVPSVASAILWLWLLHASRSGLANSVLGAFNLGPLRWLGDPAWAKPALVMMSLWGIGGTMIIYLAGLQSIPVHLYEAAKIDGASSLGRFWNVTLPLMTPTIFYNLVMGIVSSFQVFNAAYITTSGGPANATYFYMLLVYDNAFQYFRMGYASAMAWMLFVVIITLTLLVFRSSGRWVHV